MHVHVHVHVHARLYTFAGNRQAASSSHRLFEHEPIRIPRDQQNPERRQRHVLVRVPLARQQGAEHEDRKHAPRLVREL